jgi:ABC-type Fe3+-hydroxamate transport system substrate-binding protein
MTIDRRTLLGGLSAALIAPPAARAASVTDDAGRGITIPDKVERIFAAGPPAVLSGTDERPEEWALRLRRWKPKALPLGHGFRNGLSGK